MCRTRKKGKDKKTFASLLQYIFACPRSRFAKNYYCCWFNSISNSVLHFYSSLWFGSLRVNGKGYRVTVTNPDWVSVLVFFFFFHFGVSVCLCWYSTCSLSIYSLIPDNVIRLSLSCQRISSFLFLVVPTTTPSYWKDDYSEIKSP